MEREPGRLQLRYVTCGDEHIDDIEVAEDDDFVVVLGTVCTSVIGRGWGRRRVPVPQVSRAAARRPNRDRRVRWRAGSVQERLCRDRAETRTSPAALTRGGRTIEVCPRARPCVGGSAETRRRGRRIAGGIRSGRCPSAWRRRCGSVGSPPSSNSRGFRQPRGVEGRRGRVAGPPRASSRSGARGRRRVAGCRRVRLRWMSAASASYAGSASMPATHCMTSRSPRRVSSRKFAPCCRSSSRVGSNGNSSGLKSPRPT